MFPFDSRIPSKRCHVRSILTTFWPCDHASPQGRCVSESQLVGLPVALVSHQCDRCLIPGVSAWNALWLPRPSGGFPLSSPVSTYSKFTVTPPFVPTGEIFSIIVNYIWFYKNKLWIWGRNGQLKKLWVMFWKSDTPLRNDNLKVICGRFCDRF